VYGVYSDWYVFKAYSGQNSKLSLMQIVGSTYIAHLFLMDIGVYSMLDRYVGETIIPKSHLPDQTIEIVISIRQLYFVSMITRGGNLCIFKVIIS
jgi:hypothetical protein